MIANENIRRVEYNNEIGETKVFDDCEQCSQEVPIDLITHMWTASKIIAD